MDLPGDAPIAKISEKDAKVIVSGRDAVTKRDPEPPGSADLHIFELSSTFATIYLPEGKIDDAEELPGCTDFQPTGISSCSANMYLSENFEDIDGF